MVEPFLAEIRIFSFGFAPRNWAFCNGQLLPINQNQALFSLLGTYYGGNGQTNFALPDIRDRAPIHVGGAHSLGERGGEQAHTLNITELPTHTHVVNGSTNSTTRATTPANGFPTDSSPNSLYNPASNLVAMTAAAVTNIGGSQAHLNMQPFLTLNFCIALQGIFPSQS